MPSPSTYSCRFLSPQRISPLPQGGNSATVDVLQHRLALRCSWGLAGLGVPSCWELCKPRSELLYAPLLTVPEVQVPIVFYSIMSERRTHSGGWKWAVWCRAAEMKAFHGPRLTLTVICLSSLSWTHRAKRPAPFPDLLLGSNVCLSIREKKEGAPGRRQGGFSVAVPACVWEQLKLNTLRK